MCGVGRGGGSVLILRSTELSYRTTEEMIILRKRDKGCFIRRYGKRCLYKGAKGS